MYKTFVRVEICQSLVYNGILYTDDWRKNLKILNIYNRTHKLAIIIFFFKDLFGSSWFMFAIELIMTTIISIHTSQVTNDKEWIIRLVIYIGITIAMNVLCIIASHSKKKDKNNILYFDLVYDVHNRINCDTANRLYRVNKKVTESIRRQKIEKGAVNSIADFQNLSFYVCNELHDFITSNFECGEVEVTIFQRFKNEAGKHIVKMIAYKNSKNNKPATYGEEYRLSYQRGKPPVFVSVFNDLNADIKILEDRNAVQLEFSYFTNSKTREEQICQYIGVPIRTNRNMIEILLQIDVSKEKALGKTYNDLKQFAESILLPFSNLLYCSYERDLILNKFYDILEENISMKDSCK